MKLRPCGFDHSVFSILDCLPEAGFVRWTPADLPWRRLDDDGVEVTVPRPEYDERVSNHVPFFSILYLTNYEGWNVGDARRAFGRGGTEHD